MLCVKGRQSNETTTISPGLQTVQWTTVKWVPFVHRLILLIIQDQLETVIRAENNSTRIRKIQDECRCRHA
ncbi:hypothetical protein TNCV_1279141 [Trichonephila clavipes]|nr:hypothetical protein TNCV_1279141 [Trichonephila clavipes]